MRFYKITGTSREGTKHKRFATSESESAGIRKDMNQTGDVPRDSIKTDTFEVEANKASILAALNEHCGS